MSPLFLQNGKLLINDNKLATSEACCCSEYAIFFCNSNGSHDAPYNIYLNNNLLGQHAIRPEGIIDGELWVTDPDITLDLFGCDECVDCANDLPWLPPEESTSIRPYPPPDKLGGRGDDLSLFALCRDCTTGSIPLGADGREIRILTFDRNFLVDGDNTLVFQTPPWPWTNPPYDVVLNQWENPDFFNTHYGRVWAFKIAKNPLRVTSILFSSAFNDPSTLQPTFTFTFEK